MLVQTKTHQILRMPKAEKVQAITGAEETKRLIA